MGLHGLLLFLHEVTHHVFPVSQAFASATLLSLITGNQEVRVWDWPVIE
jgi:hypothetical protein